jgi:hypothetical protein
MEGFTEEVTLRWVYTTTVRHKICHELEPCAGDGVEGGE